MTNSISGITAGSQPYLSVVVTTRNDDHGGDPLKRLQAFVTCLDEQCRRGGLDVEVIVVEWNPPVDRPLVGSLLRLPEPPFCSYRFITVPAVLHDHIRHGDVLPLFQMIAKNAGIRRARGRFVLATNIDIIFSTELITHLVSQPLRPGRLYRVDRHDIQSEFPLDATLEQQMEYCASHQLRVHARCGSFPVDANGHRVTLHDDIVDGSTVSLGQGWHVREGEAPEFYRWARDRAELIVNGATVPGDGALLHVEVESNPYDPESWLELEATEGGRSFSLGRVAGRMWKQIPLAPRNQQGARIVELRVRDELERSTLSLPVFERRDDMHYRMRNAEIGFSVGPESLPEYPAPGWIDANPSSLQTVRSTSDGLDVVSDARKWSYCVEYGPLHAGSSARCRFDVTCSVLSGGMQIGVLQADGSAWIPSSVDVRRKGEAALLRVTVKLKRGQRFWLMIYNDHPDGHGVSHFVVHRLQGSIDPAQALGILAAQSQAGGLTGWAVRVASAAARFCAKFLSRYRWRRRVGRIGDGFARMIANHLDERLRGRIVRAAPEYRSLQAALRESDEQLCRLAPLGVLADLHRFLRERRPDNLHVNGCGDFQLMAREHWEQLRGYPELETFSMNIDGLFSYIADAAGIEEEILPMAIYHLEHDVGSGWSPEGEALLRRRIDERGITWVDARTVYMFAAYMRWLGRPMLFNSADWGLGSHVLEERSIMTAYHAAS